MNATKSLRILVQFDWTTGVVTRLWDGSGLFADGAGDIWHGCSLGEDLDSIEQAINGEAAVINMTLANVAAPEADLAWLAYTNDQIIGAVVRIAIQPCDAADQPIGEREIMFTGRVDNVVFDDAVANQRPRSTIVLEIANRFTLRKLESGGVLSDTDQRARSAAVNPDAPPDRFAGRVTHLEDKTTAWPKWRQ